MRVLHECDHLAPYGCIRMQKHLARTAGRWKDSPRKNTVSELQDELMSVRLREAEAQAELRETRQRMLELETQVEPFHTHRTPTHTLTCAYMKKSKAKMYTHMWVCT